jgi:hypothetical protein
MNSWVGMPGLSAVITSDLSLIMDHFEVIGAIVGDVTVVTEYRLR